MIAGRDGTGLTKHLTKCISELFSPYESENRHCDDLARGQARSIQTMTRHVKIGEAKTHLSVLLVEVETGEDLVICRGSTPVARVTRVVEQGGDTALCETLRQERARAC